MELELSEVVFNSLLVSFSKENAVVQVTIHSQIIKFARRGLILIELKLLKIKLNKQVKGNLKKFKSTDQPKLRKNYYYYYFVIKREYKQKTLNDTLLKVMRCFKSTLVRN
jgi:uncharacterized membrane protein